MEFKINENTINMKDKLSSRDFVNLKMPDFDITELSKMKVEKTTNLKDLGKLQPMVGWLLDLLTLMGWKTAWDDDFADVMSIVDDDKFEKWIEGIFTNLN